jgi:hypothetical protein
MILILKWRQSEFFEETEIDTNDSGIYPYTSMLALLLHEWWINEE